MGTDKDSSSRITLRISDSTKRSLDEMANAANTPVSTFSRQLIERALEDGTAEVTALDRLMEAEAALAEAKARHVLAQAQRVEIENRMIEAGLPLPGSNTTNQPGIGVIVVGATDKLDNAVAAPLFGLGPGQQPYKELKSVF